MLNHLANFVKPGKLDFNRHLLVILSINLQVSSLFNLAIMT